MKLILISEFMQDEIYLLEESKYYNKFDEVIFFSIKGKDYKNSRLNKDNIKKGAIDIAYKNVFDRLLYLFKGIFSKKGIRELINIIKNKKVSLYTFKNYFLFTAKSELLFKNIKNTLESMNISKNEKLLFYSYRFGIGVIASVEMKKKYKNSKIISRCHGQDLFEFRNKYEYLPYREFLYSNIDRLYCVSNDGMEYVENKYGKFSVATKLAYLGTQTKGYSENISNSPFTIVTCSRISPIKRLHLLVDVLKEIKSINIKWIHFGDGELYKDYYEKIKNSCLNFHENIEVDFRGFVDNKELTNIYLKENLSVFLNISESEGLPVSVMEACSVGLPIIATDVGGTSEIVKNGVNGFLLKKNFRKPELVEKIENVYTMNSDEFKKMSLNSYSIWKKNFSSNINYEKFVDDIITEI